MTESEIAAASSHKTDDLLKPPKRYPDLRAGGRELAVRCESYRDVPDLFILAIALGGVPVAHEVARHLGLPFDIVLIRRLLVPAGPGSDICAVYAAGFLIIEDGITPSPEPSTPLEHFVTEALGQLEARERICRRGLQPVQLRDRTILLVDCGIRTGSTMKAAIKALRTLKPKRIIGAVPVASGEGSAVIGELCDELICLQQPENFINAGYWYRDFRRPSDDEVRELL